MTSVILWAPNDGAQTSFLTSTAREVLYGGAVGGGKTDALLACALRWAWHPKHRALILRRTRPNLQESIDRSLQIYGDAVPGAQWREAESRWRFPSGAIIQMGYAEHEKDIYAFKTFEYNLICFDELTTFSEPMYDFMFLRNRTKSPDLPLMIRAATNPGDIGHDWVLKRFIGSATTGDLRVPYRVYYEQINIGENKKPVTISRQYIPSTVWDNHAMPNREEYVAGIISKMSQEDVAAYLDGRWDMLTGAMFKKLPVVLDKPTMLDSDYIVLRAIDFGIDDPTAVLWALYYPKPNVIDIVSELYLKDATLDGIVQLIKAREDALKLRQTLYSVGSPEMVNRQAAAGNQSIATIMTIKGVPVEKANSDRLAGWARVIDLIGKAGLRVWPVEGVHGAPNLMRTLPKLQRNSGPGKDPNDIRPRQDDHMADALRYICMAVYEAPPAIEQAVKRPERDPSKFDVKFDKMVEQGIKANKQPYFEGLGWW